MCLRAILKAAATRLGLDMNMDLKCYLFSENFQFSRPERRRKEQHKNQGGKRLQSKREKGESNLYVDTQRVASYSTMFLFNTSSISLLQLPLLSLTFF